MEILKKSTAEVKAFADQFIEGVKDAGINATVSLDSAADTDLKNADKLASVMDGIQNVPEKLQVILDEAGEKYAPNINRALLDGISTYNKQHGVMPSPDLIESAIHQAYSTSDEARKKYSLDSIATSNNHEPLSLQPNRAVIAILSAFGEAIPFAHYLPADIGSNEAKLAIMSHVAGHTFGSYAQGGLLDGIASGDSYITSSRLHTSKPNGSGQVTGKLTKIQETPDTCSASAGDLKLLRGRSIVYINGLIAAREMASSSGTGQSPISGTISVANTSYAISGNINTDTGEYTLQTTPSLPQTVEVAVQGFIDFERQPDLTPAIISHVETFPLYASPWRVTTHQTIDSRTQMANELNLDPHSESILAIHGQFGNERHYDVIRKGVRIAGMNAEQFDWKAASALQDSGRASVWADLAYPLGVISQTMAERTMNHGVTHLYVTKRVAAQLSGLPSTIFQPSGVTARPGIYRVGRLFGMYDVYFTPKGLNENGTSAQILCVGRATDVTRNPVVLGDAVAPTVMPLAMNSDLRTGSGFYARNFTEVNPHHPSAQGFGMIEVINM